MPGLQLHGSIGLARWTTESPDVGCVIGRIRRLPLPKDGGLASNSEIFPMVMVSHGESLPLSIRKTRVGCAAQLPVVGFNETDVGVYVVIKLRAWIVI